MVVGRAIYPVTEELLHRLFDPYNVEKLQVYPAVIGEDEDPCVAADVCFSLEHAVAQAYAYWDGRCIYYRCCRLQMWLAEEEVLAQSLPIVTPASAAVLREGTDELAASTSSVSFDHSMYIAGFVIVPVPMSSSMTKLVAASVGLADPPATVPTIGA
jgi:hypothetical protein